MVANSYVFGVRVVGHIACNCDCAEVITADRGWISLFKPISLSSLHIQVNCFATCVKAMYSALVVDRATMLCFFELPARQAPFMTHAYPDMDLVSARLAKSASA